MNNFEKLQSMSVDELSKWLDKNVQFESTPWMQWWDELYCSKCESIMCHYDDNPLEFPASWCELHDNKCKFFPNMKEAPDCKEIIKMWLESNT